MGSKVFLLLVLSIAFALLISSEVAARELAQTTVKTDGYSGGGRLPRTSGGGTSVGGNGGSGGKGRKGGKGGGAPRCHTNGACQMVCCSAAEIQALEASSTQAKPQN